MSDLIRILIAPLFWLAAFSAIYGLHGLVCAQHSDLLPQIAPKMMLVGAWSAALTVQVGILATLWHWPSQSPVATRISLTLGWTAIAAMLWSLFPVLFSPVCA